jgi:predicted aconitase
MNKDKEVHLVQYGTRDLSKTDASIKLPPLVLPASITDEVWDVIYVDAPVGRTQGRMLSIMTAMELATDETTICVHDYDRESERVWTDHIAQLMGREVKVFGRMAVLEGKK